MDQKIYFYETIIDSRGPSTDLLSEIRTFDGSTKWSTMIAYAPIQALTVEQCYDFAQKITDALVDIDILAIPLHPQDPFSVQGLRTREVPCPMMLIQRRAFLAAAKQKLLNTKYYDNWGDKETRIMTEIHSKLTERGAFFPLLWWTDEVLAKIKQGEAFPEIVVDSTVRQLTRNQLHMWMHNFGRAYGWSPYCSFAKWQRIQLLPATAILLATAHGGEEAGYAAILFPTQEATEVPLSYPLTDRWISNWPTGSFIWRFHPQGSNER